MNNEDAYKILVTQHDHTRLTSNIKDAYGHIRFAQNNMNERNKRSHTNITKHAITQDLHKKTNKMCLEFKTKQGWA